ncbi:MAG: helix-turn-helix domain-containing protein [Wenzhouxiangellaceae bacterium]|nr:helix-turn-helix domain-containing protein [Wenzhouxiangellaceae bacterium]MBS3748052.1 helix-turn-helix domain-containing protein [Wenzhouxiangellaceae bacterium]MBS3824690.1 helix-turn-helix domain-containing protein [Wenzhouxiangellaceae bacterium]
MNDKIQIIEKDGREEYAVVPMEEWRRVCALAEDAEDIRAADSAVRELTAGYDEAVPMDVVRELLEAPHPLSVWRRYRGMTQQALGEAAGIGKSYISQIESGAKIGSVKCLHRIAEVLGIDIDDLIVNDDS